jgi:DNA-binding CsgD family transcriptional regulator
MADAAAGLGLNCFAYLSLPNRVQPAPLLISTYPTPWTKHYLQQRYERFDPVIISALNKSEPFEWGLEEPRAPLSEAQNQLFEEAKKFGICCGFTIPIHDSRGPVAAITFAADRRDPVFANCVERRRDVLQLMAMYFHSHARRKLTPERVIDGVRLSPREFECLEWTAQGKSAWDIGRILGISRRTAACHLDNAKAKLGVHSNYQSVALFVAAKTTTK